jgi:hypothetical protein
MDTIVSYTVMNSYPITEETIASDKLWNKRPDGFAIKKPTDTKGGELVILEFKRMSCVTDQYVKRAKHVAEAQYEPLKSALQKTLGLQGWTVNQKSFMDGARSLNEQDLHDRVGKKLSKSAFGKGNLYNVNVCGQCKMTICQFQRFFTVSLAVPSTCLGCPSKRTIL